MIIAAVESYVALATVLAIVAWLISALVHRAAVTSRWSPHPRALARAYAGALFLPPLAAIWIVAAAALPAWLEPGAFEAAHDIRNHTWHLVGNITHRAEPLLGTLVAAILMAAAGTTIWSYARAHARISSLLRHVGGNDRAIRSRLRVVARAVRRAGIRVAVVTSDHPLSILWGFRQPTLVLSRGVLGALTATQLTGVVAHEIAHRERRDNVVKLLLTICASASIVVPLARRVLHWHNEQVELICDEEAVRHTGAPLALAEALVTLARRARHDGSAVAVSGFVPDDTASLERRVARLLRLLDGAPRGHVSRITAGVAVGVASITFVASLIGVLLWTPLAVHSAAEIVLDVLH